MGELLLVRHGQTAWTRSGRHTGRTDVPLTPYGERQAASLRPVLAGRRVQAAWTSPLQRARRTAELAGLRADVDDDLVEWDNGLYEGRTTEQVRQDRPDWWLWTDGAPSGEDWRQVEQRCARTVERVAACLDAGAGAGGSGGDVVLVGHGHALRALAAVWVGLPAWRGGALVQDPASLSVLGTYRGHRVVRTWNDTSAHPQEAP